MLSRNGYKMKNPAKRINELENLLKRAKELLYCANYARTATRPCLCQGCSLREEIARKLSKTGGME